MALTQVAGGMLAGSITSSQISSVAGSTLTGSQSIPKSTLPTGSVLQVVSGTASGGTVTTNSSTLTDTGLTATITPTSATSKILVLVCHWECYVNASGKAIKIALFRNATKLGNFDNATIGYVTSAGGNYFNVNLHYFDSPASTSALTYKTQFASFYGTGEYVGVQGDGTYSYITLMEIAA